MAASVYVGIAGWSYADWEGLVYPAKGMDQLAFISDFVDVIEINNSFYRPPSVRNSESWLRRTQEKEGFFFTAKLHRDFTHGGRVDQAMVRQFHEGFAPLLEADRLRHLLVQFRYDFDDSARHRQQLSRIVDSFGDAFHLAVEVRHVSWQAEESLGFLDGLGVTVANLDYPVSSKSFSLAHCTVGREGYFRLHGRNYDTWFSKAGRDATYNYYYSAAELGQVKCRIDALRESLSSLTVITNNHYRGGEIANALELKAMLSGCKVAVPANLLATYPNLASIAES